MRASTRALRYSALVAAVPTGILLTASQAFAAPDPPDDGRCDLVVGAAKEFCESEGSSSGGGTSSTPDPLGSTLD
ncbi:hypothetical protein HET66_29320, partial [Streptomyces sp. McG6]|nr:hypothetical protein [Streptomyces sp. McG6]